MPEQKQANGPVVPTPEVAASPLLAKWSTAATCREVERIQIREPGDRVYCAHLFGDYYRCNWWARVNDARKTADYDWSALLTDHIRKSSFLKVTIVAGVVTTQAVAEPPLRRGIV